MTIQYLKSLEDEYLQVLSECSVGRFKYKSFQDIQEEILRRLKLKFNEKEITIILNCVSNISKANFASYSEILLDLIEHTRNTFIPATNQIRAIVKGALTPQEKKVLLKSKHQYLTFLDQYISDKKDRISKNNKVLETRQSEKLKELELTHTLYGMIPMFEGEKDVNKSWYPSFSAIANKHKEILDDYYEKYVDLLQERIKIRFGKLGNIISTTRSIGMDYKLRTNNWIIELLFIEVN